jgi:hypothetical protein
VEDLVREAEQQPCHLPSPPPGPPGKISAVPGDDGRFHLERAGLMLCGETEAAVPAVGEVLLVVVPACGDGARGGPGGGGLNQLCEANPHLASTGSASPALLTRDLVIYPETVDLAHALTTLPNRPHRTPNDTLTLIACRLGLARLTPNANDPLRAFLTHTRHRPAKTNSEARRERSRL